jgi:uncharacterized protein
VSRALLDVNVLIALLDSDHVDHRRAVAWFTTEVGSGWASCALTQNGFIRIISQPRYPSPIPIERAVDRLAEACADSAHEFWPCSLSLLDRRSVTPSRMHGSAQVTDAYLLALAVEHGGRFVTFDRSVPVTAVPGARSSHLVIL